jgi:hypothetical protein
MADTPLQAYAKAEQQKLKDARAEASQTALAAEKNYADARDTLGKANNAFAALERDVAKIRKELSEAETPAEGEAKIKELADKIVTMRTKSAEILKAEEDAEVARAGSEQSGAELKRMEALLAVADASLVEVEAQAARLKAMIEALGKDPLLTLKQKATDALNHDPFKKAKTRIEKDVPEPLHKRARERRQIEIDSLRFQQGIADTANSLVATELNTNGGLSGKAEKLKAEYERASAALRDYVGKAKERYDYALALAARVADPGNEPLTANQFARIHDATLVLDGGDAADLEKLRDDARSHVKDMEAEVEKAILMARAAHVDADPELNDGVKDARKHLKDADDARKVAETNFLTKHQKNLDTWEAEVPDPTWRQLADFEESQQVLTSLGSIVGQDFVDHLNLAESAFAAALADAARSARTLRALEAERQAREARVEFEAAAAPRLNFSALRGDK